MQNNQMDRNISAKVVTEQIKMFKKDLKKHLIKSAKFYILYALTIFVGSFTFFYIEHCYDVKQFDSAARDYHVICGLLREMQANSTTLKKEFLMESSIEVCNEIQQKSSTTCVLDAENIFKWAMYCVEVGTTIGYGHIVTRSDTGKIVTILYGIPAISITMAMNIYFGNVVVDGTKILLVIFHTRILKLKLVRHLPMKVFCVQLILGVITCITYTFVSLHLVKPYEGFEETFTNAIYFVFVTLSTIGFGDNYFNGKNNFSNGQPKSSFYQVLFLCIIVTSGLGVMASVLTGLSELLIKDKRQICQNVKSHFCNHHANDDKSRENNQVHKH